jgi:hypothetical protein
MNDHIADSILQAAEELEKRLPQVDEEAAEKITEIVERVKAHRENRKNSKMKDGVYSIDQSGYLRDLKELLLLVRNVAIPAAMKAEIEKFRKVADIVRTMPGQGMPSRS